MTEAYTVEGRLNFTSNVPETVANMVRAMRDFNDVIKSTQGALAGFTVELKELASGSRGIGALVRNLQKLSAVKLGGGEALTDMQRMAELSKQMASSQEEFARAARESVSALRQTANIKPRAPGPAGPRPVFAGGTSHANLADTAMALQMGGDASTNFFERAVSSSFEVKHVLAVIGADQRVTPDQLGSAQKLAEDTTRSVPGSTIGGNLAILNDLKNTFGSFNEAMDHLATFSRLVTTLQIMDESHGGQGDLRQALNTAKFIEDQGGAIDPNNPTRYDGSKFESIASKLIAIDVATGGRVDPQSMLAFQKQARTGGMMLDDHALYGETPYFANAFGASKLGTALFSDLQVMLGGRLMKEHEQDLEFYGVIPKGAGHYDKVKGLGGKTKYEWEYDPRSIRDTQTLASDPFRWIHDTLAPAVIAKEHLDVTKKFDLDRLLLVLTQLAQRGTQAGLWADAYRGYGPAQKEAANIGAQAPDMLKHFMDTDPTAQMMQFRAAQNEFMVTLGGALMGPAIDSLKALTQVLRDMSDWAKQHPNATKDILVVSAGLGVLAKVLGDLGMIVFIGSPVLVGFRALATSLGAFAPGAVAGLGLGTLTAGLLALGGAFSVAAGGTLAVQALLHPGGKDDRTPEEKKAAGDRALHLFRNDTPMARSLGQGPSGTPRNDSAQPSGAAPQPVVQQGDLTVVVQLDSKKIGQHLLKEVIGNPRSGAAIGHTGFDGKMTLYSGGVPAGSGN